MRINNKIDTNRIPTNNVKTKVDLFYGPPLVAISTYPIAFKYGIHGTLWDREEFWLVFVPVSEHILADEVAVKS